jgi:hypothetical protein
MAILELLYKETLNQSPPLFPLALMANKTLEGLHFGLSYKNWSIGTTPVTQRSRTKLFLANHIQSALTFIDRNLSKNKITPGVTTSPFLSPI